MKFAIGLAAVLLIGCESGTPTEPGTNAATAFTVALNITCARGRDSAAYCWGASVAGVVPMISPVGQDLHFSAVFGGAGRHICALTALRAAYCWGDGQWGQLGNARGNMIALQPVAVQGGLQWRDLALGGSYTCGVTTGGELYCWGTHNFGQDCTATFQECAAPRAISAMRFRSVSASRDFACALGTDDAVYCWGVGPGATDARAPLTPVAGHHRFSSVSVGLGHACGIAEARAAFCWGNNQFGQLGVPYDALPVCDALGPCTNTPVEVSGALSFAQISAGYDHTCGITLGGTAYCWGANYAGELGIGPDSAKTSFQPARVSSTENFSAIAASQSGHTCAQSVSGTLYCWGNNGDGEVGADTTSKAYRVPVPVDARLLPH